MRMSSAFVFIVVGAASPAQADNPVQRLSADMAQIIVETCKKEAIAAKRIHSIAVVDAGGNPVATLRMEGSPPGVMAFATEKAKAAALWGFPTSGMEQAAKSLPGFANAPNVVAVGGGVPIYSADGTVLIGGAGTSGASPAPSANDR